MVNLPSLKLRNTTPASRNSRANKLKTLLQYHVKILKYVNF